MVNRLVSYLFILLIAVSSNSIDAAEKQVLKVIRGEGNQRESISYFHQLLIKALEKTKEEYGDFELEPVEFNFSQNRTLKLLNLPGVLDVTYSMTSEKREKDFVPVKVPLLNGMFGKRLLLVKPEFKDEFETLNFHQLKKKVACQGLNWPDFETLSNSGFEVYGVVEYESNFKMLAKGRCDYFPRGIHEAWIDLRYFDGVFSRLALVSNIMLQYEAPVYFFVGKHNKQLSERIYKGLVELKANSEMQRLLESSQGFEVDPEFEKNPNLRIYQINHRK